MVINGSALNVLTLNFGGNVDDVIIRRLITTLHPPGTSVSRKMLDNLPKQNQPPRPTELERINVSVVFGNLTGEHFQDMAHSHDLVTITNIFLDKNFKA